MNFREPLCLLFLLSYLILRKLFLLNYEVGRMNENLICYHAYIRLVTEYFLCNRISMNFQIHEIIVNVNIKYENLKLSMKLQTIKREASNHL